MSHDVTPMRIGDRLVGADGEHDTTEVISPYDGRVVGSVPRGTESDIDAAVAAAHARHTEGALPAWRRAEILDTAARLLRERIDDFATVLSAESAKPITTARTEATRAVDTLSFSAAVARTMTGELVPMDASAAAEGKLGFVLRVPIGVVAGISPFNFPLNLVCHKVAPAIAAGCPMVLKPASTTPLTALALARLLVEECGLPDGWLNVVTAPGSVANRLVDHPDVAMITFTGSPEVGWGIRGRAARKKVSLELGNNSPIIIEPDADWSTAAAKIKVAGFSFAGQSCISVQRVYVHESIADEFTDRLVELVASIVVGDPADPTTEVSALIDPGETKRVSDWVNEAVDAGATLRCGGTVEGSVLLPTVLTDVEPDMAVCAHEVFGPVVAVQTYTDFDEALRLANDSTYGLQAGVFTPDIGRALQSARTLEYGGVMINEVPTWRADQMPYGGVRDSGNTREGPSYAAREMTEQRLVVIQG
jgi:acyl-CoA reductase-like NAD-dependent aldehyde dehydrogenase